MDKLGKWEIKKRLGEGGQGEVFLAFDTGVFERPPIDRLVNNLGPLVLGANTPTQLADFKAEITSALKEILLQDDPRFLGALKVLRKGKNASDYDKAKTRMRREIEIYQGTDHANLLRLKDSNLDEDWLVTEYQPKGTLADNWGMFHGDLLGALRAIRPVVDAVRHLHGRGMVHRDIKPGNIFVGADGRLILGDAGLVFLTADKTRVTDTFENVGTRDYMPAWAMGMRIEEVRPTFDMFSLGKVIWSMVAGRPAPPLWYVHKDDYELEKIFSDRLHTVNWARLLLDLCVVEDEKNCEGSAANFLSAIDQTISALDRHAQVVGDKVRRRCIICGFGYYELYSNEDINRTRNFGIDPHGNSAHKVFLCNHCGHAEIFFIWDRDTNRPRPWRNKP